MSKTCNSCKTNDEISKVTMSSADWQRNEQRHERREKRFIWLIALLIVLLVGSNIGWLIYEAQFEVVEKTITTFEDVVQESAEGNNNIVGGDFVNGEANN